MRDRVSNSKKKSSKDLIEDEEYIAEVGEACLGEVEEQRGVTELSTPEICPLLTLSSRTIQSYEGQ